MQIGFNLPISGPLCSSEILTRIAQEGEALGYDYLTLTDHIVLPNLRVPGYPYSESGEFFSEGPERRHEQLTTAAYIAAKTSRMSPSVSRYRSAIRSTSGLGGSSATKYCAS